ncbi:hypothetical protein, partial [Stenotrophomonas maltophilia]|uniref:hypothetical protein n=1 Tax=Stenotrophomonas maltophilia TaxID=40324 RepID=UPI0013DB1F63
YGVLFGLGALDQISLTAIRSRERNGNVQRCAANLSITGKNGLPVIDNHQFAYTLEITTDGQLYGTVH